MKWGDRTGAWRELQTLEAAWPAARTNFVGEAWAASWADWEPRLKKLKRKVQEPTRAVRVPARKTLTRVRPNACKLNCFGGEDFLLGGSILIAGSR